MSGPVNAVSGDLDEPTNLPVSQVPEALIEEEKKMARYSQSAEFKRLRDYMEARIKFFQTYLPDGKAITAQNEADDAVIASHWRAANIVISEFKMVLNEYDNAKEVVEHAGRER